MTDIADRPASTKPARRSPWRSVTMPTEHGGWGLTAEPVIAGFAIAPSVAGMCLGFAAILAFLAHTPLRIVLVDRHRNRDLERTAMARRVLAVEVAACAALLGVAAFTADGAFWWPAAIAAPLVAVQLWFDTRSHSRRLIPELAGTYGICAVAAMILLAAGHQPAEAVAVWLIFVGRATTSVPHVRAQVARLHGRSSPASTLVAADALTLAAVAAAVALDPAVTAGAVAVVGIIAVQRITARTPVPAKVAGIRQSIFGLVVVVATVLGVYFT
ncbi:MAG TPA: YwiC-like family protein [Microthrixaceae bacterium]|nr:YwiC-like family protein [Microthrixaceae bacterium]